MNRKIKPLEPDTESGFLWVQHGLGAWYHWSGHPNAAVHSLPVTERKSETLGYVSTLDEAQALVDAHYSKIVIELLFDILVLDEPQS